MPRHQSPAQRKTVERVMHEYKHGELKSGPGGRAGKVKNPKQAIAIALHEAGASKSESPKKNAENLRHTKAKERRGETYRDEAEGKRGHSKSRSSSRTKSHAQSTGRHRTTHRGGEKTKAELYAEARRRDIPGRSKMDKAELQRALAHA